MARTAELVLAIIGAASVGGGGLWGLAGLTGLRSGRRGLAGRRWGVPRARSVHLARRSPAARVLELDRYA